ncbi:hypothetical protein [uncultured Chryseobacterium sp.]|uniref:hypothetical protein n=1 Tax=uncultured Chryseobacterium sp. TaxID=259322 RepID=UPI0025EA34C5|nr:hypothetical protein [uncultured Chryseobacterium sp.]
MKDNMLNKLKSGYEEMKIQPSANLWERLDRKMDEKPEIAPKAHFQWGKYAAVAVLLISIGTISYFNYKKDFNLNETDHIVKKELEKTAEPVLPPINDQSGTSAEEIIPESKTEKIAENPKSGNKKEIRTILPGIQEAEVLPVVIKTSATLSAEPLNAENAIKNLPVIAETKNVKTNYVSADELLLGREFDKSRENLRKEERRFGVFNIGKVFQKVDNVTVLGVTVYSDPK